MTAREDRLRPRPVPTSELRLLLTAHEVAAVLGVGYDTALGLMQGDLPVVLIGSKRMVPVDGLRDWCNAAAVPGHTTQKPPTLSALTTTQRNRRKELP